MNSILPQNPTKKPKIYTNDSILEAIRHMGSGVGSTVAHDVVEKGVTDAWASLLGQTPKMSGELTENQPINFNKPERQPAPTPLRRVEAPRSSLSDLDTMKIREQLAAVRQELKALSESVKSLHTEVAKAIEDIPVNPGVYHINFLMRLRSMLVILKEQIDDSRAWLNLSSSRKQKKQYWGLYKKHGTQFGLSSERTLATQAG